VRALEAQLAEQAQAQQAALVFEQEYDHLVRLLGQALGEVERVGIVQSYLSFVDGLLQRYQQHPGLVSGERYPQQRLVLLQELRAQLAAHQALLQQREAYLAHQRRQQGAADEAIQQAPQNASALPQATLMS
jgi:hypothetical protein